jgi:hypothetical protein
LMRPVLMQEPGRRRGRVWYVIIPVITVMVVAVWLLWVREPSPVAPIMFVN